jgi:mono/diheme cytochrome c family protein
MRTASLLLGIASFLAAGCGTSTSSVTALTGDATAGKTVYAAQCQACHGADGISGSAHRAVPSFATTNPDKTVSFILDGKDEMPAFSSTLTDQEIANVLAYAKTL